MPARSRDIAALRRFAEAHAAAHAKAATVRPDAACGCRQQKCAAHEGSRVGCAGAVVLVLRHDPAVGQVWTLAEVCSACAPLMTHTKVVGRATPRARPSAENRSGENRTGTNQSGAHQDSAHQNGARQTGEAPYSGPQRTPPAGETRSVPSGFSEPPAAPQDGTRRRGGRARASRTQDRGGR